MLPISIRNKEKLLFTKNTGIKNRNTDRLIIHYIAHNTFV